jgi:hypothetical protein
LVSSGGGFGFGFGVGRGVGSGLGVGVSRGVMIFGSGICAPTLAPLRTIAPTIVAIAAATFTRTYRHYDALSEGGRRPGGTTAVQGRPRQMTPSRDR